MQRVLAELDAEGLVRFTRVDRGASRAWYLTEDGAELAEALPHRVEDPRKLLDPAPGIGTALQAHTLAVNEVWLSFLRAARERGDEFSARSCPTRWLTRSVPRPGCGAVSF